MAETTDEQFHNLAAKLDRIAALDSHVSGFCAAVGVIAILTAALPAMVGIAGSYFP